jgi:hypothetical protein
MTSGLGPAAVVRAVFTVVVTLLAAVVHATEVGTIALRSLLALAGPGAVILVFAVAAAW